MGLGLASGMELRFALGFRSDKISFVVTKLFLYFVLIALHCDMQA